MEIFALFMLCGIFTTLLIPETKRRTLEQLAETYHGDKKTIEELQQNEETLAMESK